MSLMVKRVPLAGGAVPRLRAPQSSSLSPVAISAGISSVDHINVDADPGREDRTLVAGPSISTFATPFASWPVTTRRIGGRAADICFSGWLCAEEKFPSERPIAHRLSRWQTSPRHRAGRLLP